MVLKTGCLRTTIQPLFSEDFKKLNKQEMCSTDNCN